MKISIGSPKGAIDKEQKDFTGWNRCVDQLFARSLHQTEGE